jgi:hypothetical protein
MTEAEFDFDEAPTADVASPRPAATARVVPDGGEPGHLDLPHSTWREVPQARFLSWSAAMQNAYCAARDRDSAIYAENDAWTQFYIQRARSYDASV